MEKNKKLILIAVLLVIFILGWAPWMDEKKLHDKVFEQITKIDGIINKQTGELICDYNVGWFPLGTYSTTVSKHLYA